MRKMLTLLAVVYSASAFAQGTPAPAGDKPAAQAKPRAVSAPMTTPKSVAGGLLGCLSNTDDGTKARLDCFDSVAPPKSAAKPPAIKGVLDCRYVKEQDERLACFNDFAERIPKFS